MRAPSPYITIDKGKPPVIKGMTLFILTGLSTNPRGI